MALPFDDWFYHLSARREDVNARHKQCMTEEANIQSRLLALNDSLDLLKQLVANNAMLVFIKTMTGMSDLDLKNFQIELDALPPVVKGEIALTVLSNIAELVGGYFLLKGISGIGKIAWNKVTSAFKPAQTEITALGDNVASTALGSEASGISRTVVDDAISSTAPIAGETAVAAAERGVAEAVAEQTLGSIVKVTVIGIVVAVGIDAIFGAINGALEKKQLDDIIDQFDSKLRILNGFTTNLDTRKTEISKRAVEEMDRFKTLFNDLNNILPADRKIPITVPIESKMENLAQFVAIQSMSLNYFSLLMQLRSGYQKAKVRNPNVTKDTVINSVLTFAPDWVTVDFLYKLWDVLAQNSTEMKNAV